jgi:hypothetical protein
LPPSSANDFTNLTPASGRQNHTTSPSAFAPFVKGALRVHRIPPRVRDDREPPLQWDETAKDIDLIWVNREAKYFCKQDWTDPIALIRLDKLSAPRIWIAASVALLSHVCFL